MIKDIELDKLNMGYFDGKHKLEPQCEAISELPFTNSYLNL